jgi:hypothetical protein
VGSETASAAIRDRHSAKSGIAAFNLPARVRQLSGISL